MLYRPQLQGSDAPGAALSGGRDRHHFDDWRATTRRTVLTNVQRFLAGRPATALQETGIDSIGEILAPFISGGKCLRSTFMYLGWLCGAGPDEAALRAASSMELLHAFALLQDDVMDNSAQRRGRPTAHVRFADWHRSRGLSSSPRRFGESAAVLLGDLCLIWAEQMLRESGLPPNRLQRIWTRYDAMRCELAIGQFADIVSDIGQLPSLDTVLEVARRKSGNYTVRRPVEIGAAMAGCDEATLTALGRYGAVVGEAFQLRDDVLGIFGSPEATGKPANADLLERKPTSVVVAAHAMADASTGRALTELMRRSDLDDRAVQQWRELIWHTGAVERIEALITEHLGTAEKLLADMVIDDSARSALAEMAAVCTDRAT